MKFKTEEDAYEFYLKYAKQVGFDIRRSKSHNDKSGKLADRIFYCCAQGKRGKDKRDVYVKSHRPETRFGCDAKMKISCRKNGNLSVEQFVKEHNHYLSSPNKTHLYRSHRNISSSAAIQIDMASDVGIHQKASHDLMVKQVGGRDNLGFIPQDYNNYLRAKRTRNIRVGDTGVDEDDLITNIFWCDAKMRADYGNFGYVVCFDTTYRKNNEGRPIALFVDINHHNQSIIFGFRLRHVFLTRKTVQRRSRMFDEELRRRSRISRRRWEGVASKVGRRRLLPSTVGGGFRTGGPAERDRSLACCRRQLAFVGTDASPVAVDS
ncbi:protein FAR1-RELATED SEQUENCE 5-like [Zingiber officinale]|uniref:protein FAR1-RELATED SEQUENCE 5-like n=1 Tax=Zingiber officinale TaxID=94328 RepID=UPI001C4C13E8|nr:protein FAR1-RELATED SEQUENCE 5-like [Zingiber officinale]